MPYHPRIIAALFAVLLAFGVSVVSAEDGISLVEFNVQLGPGKEGSFVMEVHSDWAPLGAARFLDLVDGNGADGDPHPEISGAAFWKGVRFFRVLDGFMAQFGIAPKHEVSAVWKEARLRDDPVREGNWRGYVSFATSGPHSRTTQMFINFGDNASLDDQGFAPFARIVRGMDDVVDALFKGYGETPDQGMIQDEGNRYLKRRFPNLSYVKSVRRVDSLGTDETGSAEAGKEF